jgi:hypothetical protein
MVGRQGDDDCFSLEAKRLIGERKAEEGGRSRLVTP